jgi:hypothetical protein
MRPQGGYVTHLLLACWSMKETARRAHTSLLSLLPVASRWAGDSLEMWSLQTPLPSSNHKFGSPRKETPERSRRERAASEAFLAPAIGCCVHDGCITGQSLSEHAFFFLTQSGIGSCLIRWR